MSASRRPIPRRVWAVLLAGLGVSVVVSLEAWRLESARDEAQFQRQVANYLSAFQERRNSLEDLLRNLRALFHLNPGVTRAQFREAIRDLSIRMEGVQALAWAPRIPAARREVLEAAVRAEGYPDFEIRDGDIIHFPQDRPVRAGPRDAYCPILFLEPYEPNAHVLGYDLASIPQVEAAFAYARDSGSVALSARAQVLYQGSIVQAVVAVIPVYQPLLVPETLAQRAEQLQGYVLAVVVLPETLERLAARVAGSKLDVLLLDASTPRAVEVLQARVQPPSASPPEARAEAAFVAGPHFTRALALGGREWVLLIRRSHDWPVGAGRWYPGMLLVGGLMFTGLLAQYLRGTLRRAELVEALVAERTAELETANRRLQESQKLESLGLLAGGIAHDFNNLLTGVLGNAGLARLDVPPDSLAGECMRQVETAAQRAAELCRQLLAYSGQGRFVIRPVDLTTLVRETTELLRVSVSKKSELRLQLAPDLPAVAADATQLRQILMNLVINASEAIGDRPGWIRVTTGVQSLDRSQLDAAALGADLPPGEYVWLEVADDGCGMSPETRARIFDPFFSTKFTGRGLGLAAVLGIVRSHGGAIQVESELGQGARFRLLLPRSTGAAEPIAVAAPAPSAWKGSGTVLLVDDEAEVRNIATRILQKAGFEVDVAHDGREGLQRFGAAPDRYRVVLLDLTMPAMDGRETCREMRRIRPGVRVLLMSGFSSQDWAGRPGADDPDGFLAKPFGPRELEDAVRALLEGRSVR